jgi:hypothetical protein
MRGKPRVARHRSRSLATEANSAPNSRSTEGVTVMTEYLIAAILFVAMVTTLVYLWKREHS